jgi:two-component system sensor kinase FixL
LRGTQAFIDALRYRNGTNLGIGVVDGISRYYSRRQLPGYPLYAGYAVPEAEVLAPIRYRARILVAAMAVSTMAVLAFVVVLTLLVNRNERRAREIANENSRLEDAQRLAKIGDWNLDLRNGKTGWSPGMYELFERDPALGPPTIKEYRSWLNDENIRIIDEAFEIVMGKGLSHDFEVGLALPTVGDVYHHIVAIPLLGREGEVIGVRGTAQDISGRKLIERLEARVSQLSRIDAMNAMATTLAHELNQPLAAAVNYLAGSRRHLESNLGNEAGLREGMHAAEQQILFAGNIIRRVREMVANQPRTPTTFSLASVVDDALALIATAQDGPQPKVAQKFAADARWVSADRVQVQQVLVNLLRNALEATETGGEIIVSSRRIEPGLIEVTVADTGHGFRQSEADRFSPFATKEGGLGLGLSLSRTFIESHGGRIWTEDPDGGGAAVHFTLPAAEREAEAKAST